MFKLENGNEIRLAIAMKLDIDLRQKVFLALETLIHAAAMKMTIICIQNAYQCLKMITNNYFYSDSFTDA